VREMISQLFSFEPIDTAEAPKKKSHLNLGVLFCLLMTLAVTLWFFEFNRNLSRGSYGLTTVEWLGVTAAMYWLAMVPLVLVLFVEKFVFKAKLLPALGLKHRPNAVLGKMKYIALFIAADLVVFAIRRLLGKHGGITPAYFLLQIPGNLIIAFCEETMFRGYIQGVMVRRFGDAPGILATAALFFVVHLPVRILLQYQNPAQLIGSLAYTLAGGIIFGVVARKDRCIYGSMALHFSFNVGHYITLL